MDVLRYMSQYRAVRMFILKKLNNIPNYFISPTYLNSYPAEMQRQGQKRKKDKIVCERAQISMQFMPGKAAGSSLYVPCICFLPSI